MNTDLEDSFPCLRDSVCSITSPEDSGYNCIAWAAGDNSRWWWPDAAGTAFRPPQVAREETVAAMIQAFATLGFVECRDQDYHPGFEKIAIFAIAGRPKHAARQVGSGLWTSKLGSAVDIEHLLSDLEGALHGTIAKIMERPLAVSCSE